MGVRLVEPSEYALGFEERFRRGLVVPTGADEPVEAPEVEGPGWGETIWQTATKYTDLGSATYQLGLATAGLWMGDEIGDEEPFNPYDFIEIPGWYDRHPWMHDAFESGAVMDANTRSKFHMLEGKLKYDWDDYEQLGRAGFIKKLAASIPSQLAEAYVGRGVLKAIGLGAKAAQVGQWARRGTTAARAAKLGSLGAASNVAQELGLIALNPDRPLDNVEEVGYAALFGGAFGAGIPVAGLALRRTGTLAAGGVNGLGRSISTRRLSRMNRSIADSVASPEFKADLATVRGATDDSLQELRAAIKAPSPQEIAERAARDARRAQGTLPFVGDDAPLAVDPTAAPRPKALGTRAEPQSLTILETSETRPLIDKVKARHGDAVIFQRHPLQDSADYLAELDGVQKTADALRGTNPGAAARLMKPYVAVLESVTPGARLKDSPAFTVRKAVRTIGDMADLTAENVDRPLAHAARISAEGIKRNLDAMLHYPAWREADDAFRSITRDRKPVTYTFADGSEAVIRPGADKTSHQRNTFSRAVTDYMFQLEEASHNHRQLPDAPAPIRRAAGAMQGYLKEMGIELRDVGLLKVLDPDRVQVSHRWIPWKVRESMPRWVRRMTDEQRYFRNVDYETGKAIVPDERALEDGVVKFLSKDDQRELAKALADAGVEAPTEGWLAQTLGDGMLARYLAEVDNWHRARAESAARKIGELDGPAAASEKIPAVLRHRDIRMRPTQFSEFLEDDAFRMLEEYHHQTSGRVALRRAIKDQADLWGPLVKELTGDDLAKSGWDPDLLVKAVKADHQRWADIAGRAGDPTALKTLERSRKRAVRILEAKMAELQGIPLEKNNLAGSAGWGRWAERQLLRATYMAYLGKVGISQIPDLAGLSMFRHLDAPKLRTMRRMLMFAKDLPPKHMQALYVAMNDTMGDTRSLALSLVDMPGNRPYGPGLSGRFMHATDAFGDKLARKFSHWTGMNLFNRATKRSVALLQMQDLIAGAGKMADATRFMADGLDQAAALKKAGLSTSDAARYNRLGLNADRSQRLLDRLFEDGVDLDGNQPWTGDRAAFDAFIAKDAVFPEFNKWWKADRDLFDTFTQAVNSETMNIIVEPKLMSRPLHLQTGIGRLVQQFQMFNISWGAQLGQVASQRPARQQAAFFLRLFALGGVSDAIHNHLSGRRSFGETAEMWQENPLAMAYHAVDRSGMTGWLARPLSWADQLGVGPMTALGDTTSSRMYYQNIGQWGTLGAPFDYLQRVVEIGGRAADRAVGSGRPYDWSDWHHIRRVLPIVSNLAGITAVQRITEAMGIDNPFGPGEGIDVGITGPAHEATRRQRAPQP